MALKFLPTSNGASVFLQQYKATFTERLNLHSSN